MKVNEYLIQSLIYNGVDTFFLVTGGAIIPTVDYLGKLRKENLCKFYCFQHEQSAAMAAEGYYRASGKIACVLTTSGPGAQNLLNGVCGCWFDSIPAVFITGQTNSYETIEAVKPWKPKQVGFQECPVIDVFKPFTKFCQRLNIDNFYHCIEKGFKSLLTPRMGPILFDFPVDIQNYEIEPDRKINLYPTIEDISKICINEKDELSVKVTQTLELIKDDIKKPLVLIGNGARDPEVIDNIKKFVENNDLPFVVSWGGFDLIEHDHPNFMGHIGVYGKREANYAIQNCDLLIVFGSRLDSRQTGGKFKSFATHAYKIVFDVDENEINKRGELGINDYVCANLRDSTRFLTSKKINVTQSQEWKNKAKEWKNSNLIYKTHEDKSKLTSYEFLDYFFKNLPEDSLIIPDQGGNLVWTMQSAKLKKGQNLFTNFGNSSMGYALPAAIGAYLSGRKGPIYVIDGDGGFSMNVQDLHTVRQYNIPLKIIILNNNSYGIIKQFQDTFFNSRYYATSKDDYYSPDYYSIAKAYKISPHKCSKENYKTSINNFIFSNASDPELFNVEICQDQKLEPKLEFGNSLENMSPYLEREEIIKNMFYEPEPANIPNKWVDTNKIK